MADKKISGLIDLVGPLVGTEEIPMEYNGSTIKCSTTEMKQFSLSGGLTATYNFGGGGSGDIASMTFVNGLLTAVTLVP